MNWLDAVQNPAVLPVLVFLAAVALHILCGAALHLLRLHDFDWGKFGEFVEHDFAVARGIAILVTFVMAVAAQLASTAVGNHLTVELLAAIVVPPWLALVASCGSAVLPILRDSLYDFVQLLTGTRPMGTTKQPHE